MKEYLFYLKKIELDRINGNFEEKFKNIRIKLIFDIDKIGLRKWVE